LQTMSAVSNSSRDLSQQSERSSVAARSPATLSVMVASFLLMIVTLIAGMPLLSLAFFGASAGNVFSLLIDHRQDIADARASLVADRILPWY